MTQDFSIVLWLQSSESQGGEAMCVWSNFFVFLYLFFVVLCFYLMLVLLVLLPLIYFV
jgi:hypothetical protein